MALMKCENLSFAYDGKIVLEGVNFELDAGDYLCIVGENGSGKSTLIKGLLGLKAPFGGNIIYADGLKATEIGYLPQQTQMQKDFPASVNEVVLSGCLNRLGLRFGYGKKEHELAQFNMERMGIENLGEASYHSLSGGQQQRVLLARALCATKKLLLLDEPVTGLDPIATGEMYNLIKLINLCDNISVIMVSHDIHEAVRYATKILHLGHKQLFFGTSAEYKESDFARRFLGVNRV